MLLIDTNIAIHLRDNDERFVAWLQSNKDAIAISLASLVELKGGLAIQPELRSIRRGALDRLLQRLTIVALGDDVVEAYGAIVEACGFSRRLVFDRLIAATAIVHDLTLVTINGDDFRDIPDLRLEIWSSPG